MSQETMLVTGATGMVGGLVARRAVERGYRVRALVRDAAGGRRLVEQGIELVMGDLAQPDTLPSAVEGADWVVHTAAHVGDWGPAEMYRAINVVALEHLLTAAARHGRLKRWIQISSLGVYPARHHYGTDESCEIDIGGLDGYTRTKAEAEVVLRRHMDQFRLPVTILRPGFIYGPGDRHVVPRLIERLEQGTMKLIGDGQKLLNNTYVGNLADAVFLAIQQDGARGQTYNIRDQRLVTREEFVGTIADLIGRPRPRKVPLWLAKSLVGVVEGLAKARGATRAPMLTRARIKFLTLNLDYSIDKACRELGYQPAVDFQEGIRQAVESYRAERPVAAGAA